MRQGFTLDAVGGAGSPKPRWKPVLFVRKPCCSREPYSRLVCQSVPQADGNRGPSAYERSFGEIVWGR